MTNEIQEGVFTPWAQLICLSCNNKLASSPERVHARHIDRTPGEYPSESNAICDSCTNPIFIDRTDVASCVRVRDDAEDAYHWPTGIQLWQTGGMSVAAGVESENHKMMITPDEDEDASADDMVIGVYAGENQDPLFFESYPLAIAGRVAAFLEHEIESGSTLLNDPSKLASRIRSDFAADLADLATAKSHRRIDQCPVCESDLIVHRSLVLCAVEAQIDVRTGAWSVVHSEVMDGPEGWEDVLTCEGGCTAEQIQIELESD